MIKEYNGRVWNIGKQVDIGIDLLASIEYWVRRGKPAGKVKGPDGLVKYMTVRKYGVVMVEVTR